MSSPQQGSFCLVWDFRRETPFPHVALFWDSVLCSPAPTRGTFQIVSCVSLCWGPLWLSVNKWATGNVLCAPGFLDKAVTAWLRGLTLHPDPTSTPAGAEA